MPAHFDLLIRNGTCVLPWGVEATDVGVRNGRIAALGVGPDATAESTIDAKGLHVRDILEFIELVREEPVHDIDFLAHKS